MRWGITLHFIGKKVSVVLLPKVATLVIQDLQVRIQSQFMKSWSQAFSSHPEVLGERGPG
jgi:hypothetical protein